MLYVANGHYVTFSYVCIFDHPQKQQLMLYYNSNIINFHPMSQHKDVPQTHLTSERPQTVLGFLKLSRFPSNISISRKSNIFDARL